MTQISTDEDGIERDAEVSPESQVSLSVLEEKYRDQMRQIFPQKIELPMLTLATQIEEQINLRPDFQRRDRWTNDKRSRFIESIVMNVPVPPVFLGEEEYGKYVVLDGRQRLTAAYRFLKDELVLEGLKVWTELNGKTYSQIKREGFGASISRRFLSAVLLTRESSPEVKYEVFERLNTGGVRAEPMEVRNAVFPGRFTELIHLLSRDQGFRTLWGIPVDAPEGELERSAIYRDMTDLELVLRFFALEPVTLGGMRFQDRLSFFMNERNRAYIENTHLALEDEQRFSRAIKNSLAVFGKDAFRKPDRRDGHALGQRSAPYADAIMYAMSLADPRALVEQATKERIKSNLRELLHGNETFRAAVSTGTNGETAIQNRLKLAREAVESAIVATSRDSQSSEIGNDNGAS